MHSIFNIICLNSRWLTSFQGIITLLFLLILLVLFKQNLFSEIKGLFLSKRIQSKLNTQPSQIYFCCYNNHNRTLKCVYPNISTIFGHNVAELKNDAKKSFISIVHPDDRELLAQKNNFEKASHDGYIIEYRIITTWGSIRWVVEEGNFRKKFWHNTAYIEGIITDVTDKHYMNDVIAENESRFNTFLENAPIGICICYNELITYANPQFLNMFRFKYLEDILGISPTIFINHENREEFIRLLKNANTGQLQIDFSTTGLRKDDSTFPVHAIFTDVLEGEFKGKLIFLIDITELKRQEQALQESERKARIILETIEDFIVFINMDSTILDCNSIFAKKFNLTRDDLIGKKAIHLVPKATLELWEERVSPIFEHKTPFNFEYKSSDGITIYSINIYPIKNAENEVSGLVVYGHDLTLLKQAENTLKEREYQYRTITESISDYVYKIVIEDQFPQFLFNNVGCERIIGYSVQDFTENPNLFLNILMPEEKPTLITHLENCIKHKTKRTIEHRIKHKNGKIIWVSNSIIFLKESSNKLILNGVLKDITLNKHTEFALLEVERRYRAVFDQSGLATNVFDLNGKLIMQNSLAANLLGGSPANFIGKTVNEIISPVLAKGIRIAISKAIKTNTFVNESKLKLPTGKYWLKSTAHTIKNSNGENIGVQFISQNVTDKKIVEAEMLSTIIATEERERTNFAQELHDGLGPLISAIKIYTQWLSRPNAKMSQKDVLNDIEMLIEQAGAAIKEISFKLSPHILDNFGLIEAVNDFIEKINRSKLVKISLINNCNSRFPKTTEAVLYRVLCECITNTLKHANATKIDIKINKDKRKLKINYSDNGKGFDMDKVLRSKSGNGLYNIQNRIESINGFISFNSSIGKGTKIVIVVQLSEDI